MKNRDTGRVALLHQLAIDRLIPEAEKIANMDAGPRPENAFGLAYSAWCREWDFAFHRAMDRLARAAGLREMVGSDDSGRGVQ